MTVEHGPTMMRTASSALSTTAPLACDLSLIECRDDRTGESFGKPLDLYLYSSLVPFSSWWIIFYIGSLVPLPCFCVARAHLLLIFFFPLDLANRAYRNNSVFLVKLHTAVGRLYSYVRGSSRHLHLLPAEPRTPPCDAIQETVSSGLLEYGVI